MGINYKKKYLGMLKWNRCDYPIILLWLILAWAFLFHTNRWWKLISIPIIVIIIIVIAKVIESEKEIKELHKK
ncbi:hypothetical protein ES703_31236 [subsurface metagenome]